MRMFYEFKPYLCLTAGTGTLIQGSHASELFAFSGLVLVACSLVILRWRFMYRYLGKRPT
jgi:hypothetical protein